MRIKGIRDIFSGLVILPFLLRGDRRTTATVYTIAIFIPICDGFVVLSHLGLVPQILIHWGTALYMSIAAWFLFCAESGRQLADFSGPRSVPLR